MWNWQQGSWLSFLNVEYDLADIEKLFSSVTEQTIGIQKIINYTERNDFKIDMLTLEALKTSEIEGEILKRDSVRSSIQKTLGFTPDGTHISARDTAITDMMFDIYDGYASPLTKVDLVRWNDILFYNENITDYRCDGMEIKSGYEGRQKTHFVAPTEDILEREMQGFITWFNNTAPSGGNPLPVLQRCAIAHFYFLALHPFNDGNGRMARALTIKCLSQGLGRNTLIALSYTIRQSKKAYYDALQLTNMNNNISVFVEYFANIMVQAQRNSIRLYQFVTQKADLLQSLQGQLNLRQEKVLLRMFKCGMEGFIGGLSLANYMSIVPDTSTATASRDLKRLTDMGALIRTGNLKGTRYHLNLPVLRDAMV